MNALRWTAAAAIAAIILGAVGCASTGKVTYEDPGQVETVTSDFGSTDLHLIAEKMVGSLVALSILDERPVLVVLQVKNKTSEHIDTKAITDKIRTTLLKSGRVRFTSTSDIRPEILDQLEFQNSNLVDPKTGIQYGKLIGAKYALHGEISSIVKEAGRQRSNWYKIDLQLTNLQNGLIEWADDKEIMKKETRRIFGAPQGE
jgi:hypothetical protein